MTSIYPSSASSTSKSTSSANLLRISGMASGIDTDAVVKSMVSNYQTKIDKANQAKQTLQWKQDAYRDIIKGIKGLQEYFDPLSDKYILSGKSLNINSAASGNTSTVSATASASAKAGTYKVNVSKLATQANITGSSLNSMIDSKDGARWENATIKFNTISVKLDANIDTNLDGKTTLDEVAANINKQVSANSNLKGKISVSADASGNLIFKNEKAAGTGAITVTATNSGSGTIFSKTITEQSSYNYNDYVSKWNNATLTLDTNLKLDAITDTTTNEDTVKKLVENINSKISANSSLNGKVSAKANGTNIVFENKSNTDISFTNPESGSVITISKAQSDGSVGTSGDISVTDISKWSGANLKLTTSLTLDNISDTNNSGDISLDEVVTSINNKISSNSAISGKMSASYINDGSSSYIKFSGTGYMKLTVTSLGGISGDMLSTKSIGSGISSTSKLISDLGFSSDTTGTEDIKFTLNGSTVSLDVDDSTTIQSLMDAVNSATSGSVAMSVDDITGKISFQSKSYGSTSSVAITNISGANDIISKLGIQNTTAAGTDSIVSITAPGQTSATTITQSSNNFTVNGVTYNLVGITEDEDTNITVTANSDTVVSNMKKFIEDYNTIISTINTKLTEKKNSDYAPLTDSQKESMSEDQIKAWEAKAKVGILKNDDYLNTLMSQLRGIFSSPVYSSYTDKDNNTKISLSFGSYGTNAIGIDTSTDYTDGGKLVLKDEAKLKSAIENNFEDFKKLFVGVSSTSLDTDKSYAGSKKYMEDGLFKRMDTILRDYVSSPGVGEDGTYTLSGSMNIFVNKQYDYSTFGYSGKNTLPDQVYKQTVSISKLKTQMSDAETRYYAKFTALEKAMSALNSQQSSLNSMLGTS